MSHAKAKQKHLPKGTVFAALDIGSQKIACFIVRVTDEDGAMEVVGVGYQASQGIKAGTIMDIDRAESAIRKTVHAAENMAADTMKGYPLRDIILNVPAVHCKTDFIPVDVQVSGQDVTDNDVRRAIVRGQDQALKQKLATPRQVEGAEEELLTVGDAYELIHTIPVGYSLDGKTGIEEPRGMFGKELGVDVTVVRADNNPLRNIANCVERSHLDITGACVDSYASGLACLVEDELELGCTVIDIGGGTSSISVFQGGKLIYASAIPVGGMHITNDVARGLNTPIQEAERIKTLYGSALASSLDDSEMIDVPALGEDTDTINHVPRSVLVGIIQPRLEEIFEMVRARLDESGLLNYLGRNVVLTGGTSQMPGIRELAQKYLDKQVRLGKPHALPGVPDTAKSAMFSTVTGLLFYMRDRFDEQPQQVLADLEPENVFDRIRLWLRQNW